MNGAHVSSKRLGERACARMLSHVYQPFARERAPTMLIVGDGGSLYKLRAIITITQCTWAIKVKTL
jgi:hypothetical protein